MFCMLVEKGTRVGIAFQAGAHTSQDSGLVGLLLRAMVNGCLSFTVNRQSNTVNTKKPYSALQEASPWRLVPLYRYFLFAIQSKKT